VTDGELAVIGLGAAGSMALWQAAKLSAGVVGSEALTGTDWVTASTAEACSYPRRTVTTTEVYHRTGRERDLGAADAVNDRSSATRRSAGSAQRSRMTDKHRPV
jgi:hypothetical protein